MSGHAPHIPPQSLNVMKYLLACLGILIALPKAEAALVVTEFGLGPDGQEFVVVTNTGGGAVSLGTISISVNNGTTVNSLGSAASMAVGDTAILSRQTIPDFAATYGSLPVLTADYFLTIAGLDFPSSGPSSIILYDSGTPFYNVGYGDSGGGGYGGNLCIVINSGPTPSTAPNTSAFSTVPEPSTALLGVLGLLALPRRRRA